MKYNSAFILLLLSVGLFYTFTNNQYQDVKMLHSLSSDYKNVLQNVSTIIELRDNLRINYNTFSSTEIENVNKLLPDNIDTVKLALDLDTMASKYNITIKGIKVDANVGQNSSAIVLPENALVYDKAKVTINFIAKYQDFKKLLADIEASLRIMNIQSISFVPTDSGLYQYEVAVETYWLK